MGQIRAYPICAMLRGTNRQTTRWSENKGTLTPSSRRRFRRHHRYLSYRRLPLRLALLEREHRQLPNDQRGLSRGFLEVFRPCPMVRRISLFHGQ